MSVVNYLRMTCHISQEHVWGWRISHAERDVLSDMKERRRRKRRNRRRDTGPVYID
jgi:hypothetical protein